MWAAVNEVDLASSSVYTSKCHLFADSASGIGPYCLFENRMLSIDCREILMVTRASPSCTMMGHALAFCRNFGQKGCHDWSTAVASDTNGNFFVSGQTDGNLFENFSGGSGQDIWVAKFDGSWGSILWSYQVCRKTRVGMGDVHITYVKLRRIFAKIIPHFHRNFTALF